jgi:hypothetical protein
VPDRAHAEGQTYSGSCVRLAGAHLAFERLADQAQDIRQLVGTGYGDLYVPAAPVADARYIPGASFRIAQLAEVSSQDAFPL